MSFLNNFGVEWVLLAAQIVNFLILLWLLKKFLYKPVLKVLNDRKNKIDLSLKQAAEIESRLKKVEDERAETLEQAVKEARQIVTDATTSADQIIQDAHAKANKDIEGLLAKSEQLISQERAKMQQELRQELSVIVTEALKTIAPRILTSKDQAEIKKATLKNL